MVTLIADGPLPLLTNAGSRRGFPRPKMAAALTYRSNGQQRRRRHLRVYIYGSLRCDVAMYKQSKKNSFGPHCVQIQPTETHGDNS